MLTLITAPAVSALTTADAKGHLRVTSLREDDIIGRYILSCTESFEGRTRRSLVTRRYSLDIPAWPGSDSWPTDPEARRLRRCVDDRDGTRLRLPRPPVQRLVSVEAVDPDGATFALSGLVLSLGAIVRPVAGWPVMAEGSHIRVTFEAGYGASDSTIPADVLQCLRLMVARDYLSREGGVEDRMPAAPDMDVFRRYEARWSV